MTDDDHGPATGPATAASPSETRGVEQTSSSVHRDTTSVVAFVVAVLVSTLSVIAGTVLLVVLAPDGGTVSILLGALGLGLLVMPPLVLGGVLAAWDVSTSEDGRRRHGRFLWSLLGGQATGVVLVLTSAAVSGSPVWLPASFVALGAALTVAALVVGPALGERARERAGRRDDRADWGPVPRGEVRRRVRAVSLTFALTFVPVAVALSFVPVDDDDGGADLLLVAAGLAFIAASCACLVGTFRLQALATAALGRDQDRARRVGRAVLSRHPVELSQDDERVAARWASVSAVSLPVQFAQTALLFAGLICQQLPQALGDEGSVFARVFVVVMVVAVLAFAPLFSTRTGRARRYAAARSHLLAPQGSEATDPRRAAGDRS